MFERHFFVNDSSRKLFCVENVSETAEHDGYGIILCKPLWGERLRVQRLYTNLSRLLCAHGFNIITCDYFGEGNSGGDALDLNFDEMAENIVTIYNYIRNQYKISKFALIGLRMGANVAIEVEKRIRNIHKMILIEPIPDLINYLTSELRSNLSTQMIMNRRIVKTREDLIHEIKNGMPVNVDGYLIGKELWVSFEKNSLLEVNPQFDGDVTFISLIDKANKSKDYSEQARKNGKGKYLIVDKEFEWSSWQKNVPRPPILFDTIISLLIDSKNI
jgi:alpha/beta superfamily hydrolase